MGKANDSTLAPATVIKPEKAAASEAIADVMKEKVIRVF